VSVTFSETTTTSFCLQDDSCDDFGVANGEHDKKTID